MIRGQIEVLGGGRHEYGVQQFTREGILQDVLEQYATWKGW